MTLNTHHPVSLPLASYKAQHVKFTVEGKLATLTLNRPERKNPLTFQSYAEIAGIFRAAASDDQVKAFVITGEGGNFCSGGDVFEIIGPLVEMDTVNLLKFTKMTGEAVKAMRAAPQTIIAAVDGVCAGAGAIDRSRKSSSVISGSRCSGQCQPTCFHQVTSERRRRQMGCSAAPSSPEARVISGAPGSVAPAVGVKVTAAEGGPTPALLIAATVHW